MKRGRVHAPQYSPVLQRHACGRHGGNACRRALGTLRPCVVLRAVPFAVPRATSCRALSCAVFCVLPFMYGMRRSVRAFGDEGIQSPRTTLQLRSIANPHQHQHVSERHALHLFWML